MKREIDLLTIQQGSVTAPAGCGKTELIADALSRHADDKPILVLTHTNAGVVALRKRLTKAGVKSKAYRLSTIDGWAMRVIRCFPMRSGHDPAILGLDGESDYPSIRESARVLLSSGHITRVVKSSYARVIVDEYQDCNMQQHEIVRLMADHAPTCVLGDPLQAIFGFSGPLVNWKTDVEESFPAAGELTRPWRWENAGAKQLGEWLLDVRRLLIAGQPVDLRAAPTHVRWEALHGDGNDTRRLIAAAHTKAGTRDGRVLIMGFSNKPRQQHEFASRIAGAIVVEAVDLKQLMTFARSWDMHGPGALSGLCDFAKSVMIKTNADALVKRVELLQAGKNRKPATEVEKAALAFVAGPGTARAAALLAEIGKQPDVRPHRPSVLYACTRALLSCDDGTAESGGDTFYDAAVKEREANRRGGRPLPKRAVGSTLLLKGLEAEAAVVLDAEALDAPNLYVAMTRGSNSLVVCSRKPVLTPPA
jgi:hypothetical protein